MHTHVLDTHVRVKQFSVEDTNRKGSFVNTNIDIRVPHTGKISCFFDSSNPVVLNPISINIKDPSEDPTAAQALVDQSMMMLNQVLLVTYDSLDDLLAVLEEDLPLLWIQALQGNENPLFTQPIHKVIDHILFTRIRNRLDACMPGRFSLNVRGILSFNNSHLIPLDFLGSLKLRGGFYTLFELGSSECYTGEDRLINVYTRKGFPRGPMNNFDFRKVRMERVIGLVSWFKRAIECLPESSFISSGRSRTEWTDMLGQDLAQKRDKQQRLLSGFDDRSVVHDMVRSEGILEANTRYQKATLLGLGDEAINQILLELGTELAKVVSKALNERLEGKSIHVEVSCFNLEEAWELEDQYHHLQGSIHIDHIACPNEKTLTVMMAIKDLASEPFFRQLLNPDNWFVEVEGLREFGNSGLEYDSTYKELIQIRAGLNLDLFKPEDILEISVKC